MTTTPTAPLPERSSSSRARSTSRSRPPHHPTTPLRPPSRTSLRQTTSGTGTATTPTTHGSDGGGGWSSSTSRSALDALEPPFAELTDALADLEANFMHLQLLHESVARFNENFAAFLYGLNMSAFCVDFPEAPAGEDAFRRVADKDEAPPPRPKGPDDGGGAFAGNKRPDPDHTFLTSDTSFVNDPPASVRVGRYATPGGAGRGGGSATRGSRGGRGIPTRGAGASRGSAAASRGSGIGRGRVRGVR